MHSSLLIDIGSIFSDLWTSMGLSQIAWQNVVMLLISFVLMFLAIVKKFEPMLLVPIAFGMFLINLPGAEKVLWGIYETPDTSLSLGVSGDGKSEIVGLYAYGDQLIFLRDGYLRDGIVSFYSSLEALNSGTVSTMDAATFNSLYSLSGFIQGTVENGATTFTSSSPILLETYESVTNRGLLWYLYYGVDKVIYPPLIFLGIGAMTDFGPLIANPKSMLIGAGAQLGIFVALFGAILLGFTGAEAAAIAIIGGADGHLRCQDARGTSGADHRYRGIFLYGVDSVDPKAVDARIDDEKGADDPHETASSGFEARKSYLSGRRYARRRLAGSGCDPASRHVDARESVPRIRRSRKTFFAGAERVD